MLQTLIIEFDVLQNTHQTITIENYIQAKDQTHLIYWIHCNPNDTKLFKQISQMLGLSNETIEICKQKDTLPRFIEENEYLLIQTECLVSKELTSANEVTFGSITILLTNRYCLTLTATELPALIDFKNNVHKYVKYAKTPCFILYLVLDNTINDYSKLLLDFEILADHIDIETREIQDNIYNNVMIIKKQIMKVQHHIASIRDILMRISGRMIAVISKSCRVSLANLLEHTHIIFNEAETIREILKNSLSQIDNALMQRLNNTMKVLTTFAAVFLPLSLIADIYGMNFRWMPELEWHYGYLWALGLMIICAISLIVIFKKMKWW